MERRIESLDQLVATGQLASYAIVNVSADNVENEVSPDRNSDRLTLRFPNGVEVTITAITTGMEDDAILRFS